MKDYRGLSITLLSCKIEVHYPSEFCFDVCLCFGVVANLFDVRMMCFAIHFYEDGVPFTQIGNYFGNSPALKPLMSAFPF